MGKCSVPFCKGKATFTFPKYEKRQILWEKAISINFQSSKSSRLWSIHFEKDLIVEKKESFYTGVTTSKKYLKPNAVPTLMLELEAEKSRRSEKIRKALFEEGSNDSSSSLPLSLLDDPMNISENIAQFDRITDKELYINNCSTISSMSYIPTDYYNIDVQMEEEVYSLPMPESSNADDMESNHVKSLGVKKQKSSAVRKKCFSSVDRITYVKGQVNSVEPEDIFLLILMKLRRNISDFGLSIYFGISEAVVRNIFNTWIHMIHQLWSLIDTWPSREVVDFYMQEGFKKLYPSTRVIVDATEIPIDKPSNLIAQQATFSTYKNKNTVKVLVGGSPDGILCYHSAAYGGSTSDRQIVERSDLVKKCQKGDSVMADRGFNVQDIFESQGVTVNIPHFLKGKQLPSVTVLSDRKLASKRVHIER
ncbi:uncharacterized protein LOC123273366 [Cotesia glomerata]|uniref:uncharacterized protein LOC123273366 n=1 Tax=Cotesia glomerata TaxID=32391 RepID=UPI001D01825F|nr:uncharacterized protein LOC123273366 [Cotesia glomerata]